MPEHNFDTDLAFAIRVVRALWEGNFLAQFEVQANKLQSDVFDRQACLRRLDDLQAGAEPRGLHAMVLDLGLMAVPLGTPNDDRHQDLSRRIGRPMAEIHALQDRIRDAYPSRFGVLIGIRAADPRAVRAANYDTPYGKGWYAEVFQDQRWLRPYDAPEFADHPDREWLSGTLGKSDEYLKKNCPTIRRLLESRASDQKIRALFGY